MKKSELLGQILKKNSFLCIGLDSDLNKIPAHLGKEADPVYEFNKQIIEATYDLCVAYKPNTAFYEISCETGWKTLRDTIAYIPNDFLVIADAKRADIGNTSTMYAKAFFEDLDVDAITLHPYMGIDSVQPFLEFEDKWAIILALTSNVGSRDFQTLKMGSTNEKLYQHVLKTASKWGTAENMMFVVGATHPEEFKEIRKNVPDHFLLVPGIGAQGGSLTDVCKFGINKEIGLLINASRSIIYASDGKDFAKAARKQALAIQAEMQCIIEKFIL